MSNVPNRSQNLLSASGAVPDGDGLYHITKAGVAALTQALPTVDAQRKLFVDETGQAHTITFPVVGSPATAGLDGGVHSVATFGGTKGSFIEFVSRNGNWYALGRNGVTVA